MVQDRGQHLVLPAKSCLSDHPCSQLLVNALGEQLVPKSNGCVLALVLVELSKAFAFVTCTWHFCSKIIPNEGIKNVTLELPIGHTAKMRG